jgi:hypothetical protein
MNSPSRARESATFVRLRDYTQHGAGRSASRGSHLEAMKACLEKSYRPFRATGGEIILLLVTNRTEDDNLCLAALESVNCCDLHNLVGRESTDVADGEWSDLLSRFIRQLQLLEVSLVDLDVGNCTQSVSHYGMAPQAVSKSDTRS